MDAAQRAEAREATSPGEGDAGGAAGGSSAFDSTAANDGMLHSATSLWRDFTALAKDHLELALLETQRAGKSAVNMLLYAVAAALLLVTAWLGLLAAIVIGLAELGLHAGFGVLIVVALNLVAAYVLYRMIRSSSHDLGFPATRRSLGSRTAGAADPAADKTEKPA